MRSAEIYRALDQIHNRFALCQVISQSARLFHKIGEPMEITVTKALNGLEYGKFRGDIVESITHAGIEPEVLFHPGDAL